MISVENLERVYHLGGQEIRALDGVSLGIGEREYVRIIGASGSGKSTLLNLLAGLDRPTAGTITTPAGSLTQLSRRELAAWRSSHVGMVFQTFNLISHRTALQNVELAMLFSGVARRERVTRAETVLRDLGLAERMNHRPGDLSGGEQQRVALARALVKQPKLLLADEPTGNLDQENATQIAELLTRLNRGGIAIVLVTHDPSIAEDDADRTIRISYGKIAEEWEHRSIDVKPPEERGG